MMRRDWLLTAAAIAIVVVLLFWQPIGAWLGLLERKEVEIDRGPTPRSRQLPLFAAEKLLQHFEVKTGRLAHLDQLPPLTDTLILPGDDVWLTPLQARALENWVERGGHLVLLIPTRGTDFESSPLSQLLDHFGLDVRWPVPSVDGVSHAPNAFQGGQACSSPLTEFVGPLLQEENRTLASLTPPLVPSAATVRLGPDLFAAELKSKVEPDCWIGTAAVHWNSPDKDRRYWMTNRHAVHGEITTFAQGDLFDNFNLMENGRAHLLLGIARFPRAGVTVWFPQRVSQPALIGMLAQLGLPLGISLALLLGAWVWRAGSRFGPLLPLPSTDRRRLLEHIEAAGRWTWKMRLADVLLAAVRDAALTRAARRDQRWRTLQGEARRQALAQRLSLSEKDLDDAFAVGPDPNAEAFTKSVRLWEKMRRDE